MLISIAEILKNNPRISGSRIATLMHQSYYKAMAAIKWQTQCGEIAPCGYYQIGNYPAYQVYNAVPDKYREIMARLSQGPIPSSEIVDHSSELVELGFVNIRLSASGDQLLVYATEPSQDPYLEPTKIVNDPKIPSTLGLRSGKSRREAKQQKMMESRAAALLLAVENGKHTNLKDIVDDADTPHRAGLADILAKMIEIAVVIKGKNGVYRLLRVG